MRVFLSALTVLLLASACTAKPDSTRVEGTPPTEPFAATSEELDRFWRLIEASTTHSRDLDEREGWLLKKLKRMPVEEIVEFEETRARVKAQTDTWPMWEACEIIQGWSSDDVFWYFQDWLISLGREVHERVTASPDALATVPEVRAMAGPEGGEDPTWEGLSYIAEQALEHRTGEDGTADMESRVRFEIPVNPDPAGDRPAEDEHRFPELRALFGHGDRLLE